MEKMQKINYGLVISDFDGTLVNEDGTICEINKQAISKYVAAGGKFAISTGRLPNGILPRAQELDLKGAVSCCQGAVIVDIETKAVLFQRFIPNAVAIKICKKIEEMNLHLHVYDVWNFYCNKDDEFLKWYEEVTRTKTNLVLDRPISDMLKETGMDVCKFIIMLPKEQAGEVMQKLKAENFEGCVITKSADYLVEVVNKNCSKGTSVEFLAKYYKIPLEKTIGVGDQWNDLAMVKTAGLGIAVNNADELLKTNADVVCEYTNEEGAIGRIIEKYGYTEE